MYIKDKQRGFALVLTLFTLVILSAVSVTTFFVARESQHNAFKTFLEIKVNNAALSGLEWAKYRVKTDNGCTNFSPDPGLIIDGLAVTLTCNQINGSTIYFITSQTSTGTYGKDAFVWRKLSLTYDTNA